MEDMQTRIQHAVGKMMSTLDKEVLRKLQLSYEALLGRRQPTHVPTRLQQYFDADVEPLLRQNMQIDMYKCSTKCCETLDTMEDVQRCVENCSMPAQRAQGVIGQELETYQERLKRCTMDCQDRVRDRVSQKASEAEMAKHRNDMEQCIIKCGESHIALLSVMMKRIKETLQQK